MDRKLVVPAGFLLVSAMQTRVVMMILCRISVTTIFVLFASSALFAGPCTSDIGKTQAQIDTALDQQAGAGKTGTESTVVTAHRQPTPETIAAAEKALGEGASVGEALAALERARVADDKGDTADCRAALAKAQKALKQ